MSQFPLSKEIAYKRESIMPFTESDRVIIEHYRKFYEWGSLKIFNHLGGKDRGWTRDGVEYIVRKIDRTGSHERVKGSGRPRSARIPENIEEVDLYLIEQGVRMDSEYYCEELLSQLIPEMTALSGGEFIFQQDGARSHTSKYTISYISNNLPVNADLLLPEDWPPRSPDLNPMDYSIWSSLARKVYKVNIRDIDQLCEQLGSIIP